MFKFFFSCLLIFCSCFYKSPGYVKTRVKSPLNSYKSPGYDNIPVYFLRSVAEILAYALSILANHSFELGYFPNCLKTAKIIPLYKSGDKSLPTNYRPISILMCFSKILEKLIYNRLTNFIDKHSVISSTQYGFRKHHSTTHAIAGVVTLTYDNININEFTGLVFLDLKKSVRYCFPLNSFRQIILLRDSRTGT